MKIAVTCPHCQRQHLVAETLAGSQARCPCGSVLTVPALEKPQESTVLVQCPSCLRRYSAPMSLSGSQSHCSCGALLTIPYAAPESPSSVGLPVAIAVPAPVEPEPPADDPTEYPVEPLSELEALPPPTPGALDELLAADGATGLAVRPLGSLAPRRRNSHLWKWLYLGLAGGSLLALLLMVIVRLNISSPPLPPEARPLVQGPFGAFSWAIPPQAQGLAVLNLERLSQNEAWRRLYLPHLPISSLPNAIPTGTDPAARFARLTVIATEAQMVIATKQIGLSIIRFKTDLSLEEVFFQLSPSPFVDRMQATPVFNYRMVPYIKLESGTGFAAKIAPNTFLVADRDGDFFEALLRWERGEAPPLDATLRGIWENTQGDVRAAFLHPARLDNAPLPKTPALPDTVAQTLAKMDWFGLSMTWDSQLSLQTALGFPNETEANRGEADLRMALLQANSKAQELQQQLSTLEGPRHAETQQLANIYRNGAHLLQTVQVTHNGSIVYLQGNWQTSETERVIRQLRDFEVWQAGKHLSHAVPTPPSPPRMIPSPSPRSIPRFPQPPNRPRPQVP